MLTLQLIMSIRKRSSGLRELMFFNTGSDVMLLDAHFDGQCMEGFVN